MRFLQVLKIRMKLLLMVGSALIGIVALVSLSLAFVRQDLQREKELKTRHLVEAAYSVVANCRQMALRGELSQEKAQRLAMATLRAMRYGGNDYFWINDLTPRILMHPMRPDLEGKEVSGLKDPDGKRFIVAMTDAVRTHGAGFVYYRWPKPGLQEPVQKLSYVKGFAPWGWVIGSGIYLDDVNAFFWSSARHYALAGVAVFLAIAAISVVVARNVAATEESLRRSEASQRERERVILKGKAELAIKHEQLRMLYRTVETVRKDWERTLDCIDQQVIMLDGLGRVKRCNRSAARFIGLTKEKIVGQEWGGLASLTGMPVPGGESRTTEFFHKELGRWLSCTCYPGGGEGEGEPGAVITCHDTTETKLAAIEIGRAYAELKQTQAQMIQQEKLASIGQLAAGVAHEINNPNAFVMSNLGTLGKYAQRMSELIEAQGELLGRLASAEEVERLAALRGRLKIDHVLKDFPALVEESLGGAERVKTIVQSLKGFSRQDDSQAQLTDLRECIESTVSIVWNELKYKVTLKRDYGELPPVLCYPQQLSQVVMNLLVNAGQAIAERGEVTIRTWQEKGMVRLSVSDTGCGIPEEHRGRIFEPFYTTKEVGKGTGLGLSISFNIVKKHGGDIFVESEPGKGTTFTVTIPLMQAHAAEQAAA